MVHRRRESIAGCGAEFRGHEGTLGKVGTFTYATALAAVAFSILPGLLPARNAARGVLLGIAGLAALTSVIGAAYFVSELPLSASIGWCFSIHLQGMTLAVVGLALPPRDVTSSS